MADKLDSGNAMTSRWRRWYIRWPLKWALFLLVVFVVCFPNPSQFIRHVRHVSDYDAMIDAGHPLMETWEGELRASLAESYKESMRHRGKAVDIDALNGAEFDIGRHFQPLQVQTNVERFIYERVPYAWDWDQWGSADYMPTVAEMYDQSLTDAEGKLREDCDGRAVLAASLLTRLGYDAKIVTDLRHVWVTTPAGESMGPGRAKTMVSTDKGNRLNIWQSLSNVPVALSYGVAVFPLWRELVIAFTAFFLLIPRGAARVRLIVGLQFILLGLFLLRVGYLDPSSLSRTVKVWPVYIGMAAVLEGLLITALARRRTVAAISTVEQS